MHDRARALKPTVRAFFMLCCRDRLTAGRPVCYIILGQLCTALSLLCQYSYSYQKQIVHDRRKLKSTYLCNTLTLNSLLSFLELLFPCLNYYLKCSDPTICYYVQRCAEESDCFVKHQPGMAGLGWLGLGRTIL